MSEAQIALLVRLRPDEPWSFRGWEHSVDATKATMDSIKASHPDAVALAIDVDQCVKELGDGQPGNNG